MQHGTILTLRAIAYSPWSDLVRFLTVYRIRNPSLEVAPTT